MRKIIELDNVSVTRDEKIILDSINWIVRSGENWAIIGRNGSGKSFLLRILSTLIYASSGDVTLFGEKPGHTDIWALRKKIGVVSDYLQREYYESITVRDVVVSGFFSSIGLYQNVSSYQYEKAFEVLSKLHIAHLAERLYGKLSQGEQKRVLIARALVFDPELLILDEPTTGLDITAREEFLQILREVISFGHNIILVTHYIEEIIPEIHKVLFMKNGKVFAEGASHKMIKRKMIREVLGADCRIKRRKGRYSLLMDF